MRTQGISKKGLVDPGETNEWLHKVKEEDMKTSGAILIQRRSFSRWGHRAYHRKLVGSEGPLTTGSAMDVASDICGVMSEEPLPEPLEECALRTPGAVTAGGFLEDRNMESAHPTLCLQQLERLWFFK